MVAFSIMMWFAAFLLFVISISLLRKNTSLMHGKVYETTRNKVGYGKALIVLVMVMMIAAIAFIKIQKKYSLKQ